VSVAKEGCPSDPESAEVEGCQGTPRQQEYSLVSHAEMKCNVSGLNKKSGLNLPTHNLIQNVV
jgi:hypothetical protein